LNQVVARHEILRTSFRQPEGMRALQQVIHEQLEPAIGIERGDAAELARDSAALADVLTREAAASTGTDSALSARSDAGKSAGADSGGGAEPGRGTGLRALLIADADADADGVLVLTVPGGCADARSMLVALDELGDLYRRAGEADEPVQYADYAQWRHELTADEAPEADAARSFWRNDAVDRPPPPELLFADLARAGGGGAAESVALVLDGAELEALRAGSDRAGVSVAVFIEAAWHALLARLSGAAALLIAGWFDGRVEPDLECAIGSFAQPGPIRTRFEEGTSFAEILDQVRRARVDVAQLQDYSTAADLIALARDARIGFSAVTVPAGRAPIVRVLTISSPAAPVAALLELRCSDSHVVAEVRFDPSALARQDAEELSRRLRTILISAAGDPGQMVTGLAICEPVERAQILAGAAGPAADEDAGIPFAALFERQVQRTPDRPAVSGQGMTMSYAELNAAANRLARRLIELGVAPNVTVGLCMSRTPAMLTALLGIVKAGGAYLPLNFEHPVARLGHQLSEAGASVVVTDADLLGRLGPLPVVNVCLDRDADTLTALQDTDPGQPVGADDLVYIMYTSGSTGKPKGVSVTQSNLSNYATYMVRRLGVADLKDGAGARYGVVSAISTDLGNTAIFPALISGGCVQLISAEASMEAGALLAELDGIELDILKITPSHLHALLSGRDDRAATAVIPRRCLVLGGEALSWALVQRVRDLRPACTIINHYGPTETTIGCCTHDVDEVRRDDCATVPIGTPIAATRAYVLDRADQPLPAGVAGELCIAGAGVALGYIGDSVDSARRFIADPFADADSAAMYRTGDRARRLRDGAIEFLGRVDDQVKIRGFRIEPGEIELALTAHPAIRQAAVSAEEDERGTLRLVGYVVSSEDPTVEQLQAFLAQTLPDYMIPTRFAAIESLPLSPSGKLDRKALAGLAAIGARREAQFVAPRDPVEHEIAEIWRELLGVERVGVFDDFFALGGHSLLATQAIMRIRRAHGAIPLRALLAAPTVAALADVVRASHEAAPAGTGS
jgi:amino acid adenylation domain-containing protein